MAKQLISVLAFLKMTFFKLGCFATTKGRQWRLGWLNYHTDNYAHEEWKTKKLCGLSSSLVFNYCFYSLNAPATKISANWSHEKIKQFRWLWPSEISSHVLVRLTLNQDHWLVKSLTSPQCTLYAVAWLSYRVWTLWLYDVCTRWIWCMYTMYMIYVY